MLADAGHLFFVFKKTISHKDNKKSKTRKALNQSLRFLDKSQD
jgi:hypothetical protein